MKKKNALNIIITLSIIIGLMIAGPVSAVKLGLKTNKANYKNDNQIIFKAAIDIQRGEQIPIHELTLKINDNFVVCNFKVNGGESCPNITITLLNPGILDEGNLFAKGFGFEDPQDTPKRQSTNFGVGYGFEGQQNRGGFNGELLYEIKWDISSKEVPSGRYKAQLEAFAENDGNQFTYLTKNSKRFNVVFKEKKNKNEDDD